MLVSLSVCMWVCVSSTQWQKGQVSHCRVASWIHCTAALHITTQETTKERRGEREWERIEDITGNKETKKRNHKRKGRTITTKMCGQRRWQIRRKRREPSVCLSLAQCKSQSLPITPVSITPGHNFQALLFIHLSVCLPTYLSGSFTLLCHCPI